MHCSGYSQDHARPRSCRGVPPAMGVPAASVIEAPGAQHSAAATLPEIIYITGTDDLGSLILDNFS